MMTHPIIQKIDSGMVFSIEQIIDFLFCEAPETEGRHILLSKIEGFLKENKILHPAQDTLERLIATQRK